MKLTWPAPLREIILVLTVTVGHFINNPSQDDRPGQGPSLSEMCARIMGVVAVTASVGIGTTWRYLGGGIMVETISAAGEGFIRTPNLLIFPILISGGKDI